MGFAYPLLSLSCHFGVAYPYHLVPLLKDDKKSLENFEEQYTLLSFSDRKNHHDRCYGLGNYENHKAMLLFYLETKNSFCSGPKVNNFD